MEPAASTMCKMWSMLHCEWSCPRQRHSGTLSKFVVLMRWKVAADYLNDYNMALSLESAEHFAQRSCG